MIFYEERTGYVENCMFIVKFYFDDNSFLSKTAVILIAGRIASGTTIPLSIWNLGEGASTEVGRTFFQWNDKS